MSDDRSFTQRLEARFEASRWPIVTVLGVLIARLWLVPLPSSFWVDELVTMFVVKHPGHASFAVAPQVPQSIYYWLPRAALGVSGPSEISFRIPSMLAMAVALWLVALLAARLVKAQLYNVSGQDAWVISGAVVALAISACIAGLIPARRAASTDPMRALRSE